ncbi:MAG: hypothetical protein HY699_08290 [Deltaproteobacteria bacterium]|nr:hypothetical protein [Deltaproteobacteria bacterium]
MDLFPRCFLLVFGQLAVGGFLALSVPPFHQIERGFYKSSAAVYLFVALLAAAGNTALLLQATASSTAQWFAAGLWWALVLAATGYLLSLWGERVVLRARAFVATWMSGLLALVVSAQLYRRAPMVSVETVLYPLSFIISALLLGAVTTGMLLGHWYLIDRHLPLAPFERMLKLFIRVLVAQAGLLLIGPLCLAIAGSAETGVSLSHLLADHRLLLGLRLLLGPLASAGLAWMIRETLKVPQTMAATGLFYIAILAVLVGEFLGRFILFRTALPL